MQLLISLLLIGIVVTIAKVSLQKSKKSLTFKENIVFDFFNERINNKNISRKLVEYLINTGKLTIFADSLIKDKIVLQKYQMTQDDKNSTN